MDKAEYVMYKLAQTPTPPARPQVEDFNQAFFNAREYGNETFEWTDPKNGKKMTYGTKRAGESDTKWKGWLKKNHESQLAKSKDLNAKLSSPAVDMAASVANAGNYMSYKDDALQTNSFAEFLKNPNVGYRPFKSEVVKDTSGNTIQSKINTNEDSLRFVPDTTKFNYYSQPADTSTADTTARATFINDKVTESSNIVKNMRDAISKRYTPTK